MEQKLERLPDAERDVMLVLWKYHSPVRTARIWQDVSQTHDWTLSTLKVLLGRLTDKGFVELTRQGAVYAVSGAGERSRVLQAGDKGPAQPLLSKLGQEYDRGTGRGRNSVRRGFKRAGRADPKGRKTHDA